MSSRSRRTGRAARRRAAGCILSAGRRRHKGRSSVWGVSPTHFGNGKLARCQYRARFWACKCGMLEHGWLPVSRIHPVSFVRGHGSDIHEVPGSGSFSARSTGSHPAGNAICRTLPLRAIQRMASLASHAVPSSSVVRTSWATYRNTSYERVPLGQTALRPP